MKLSTRYLFFILCASVLSTATAKQSSLDKYLLITPDRCVVEAENTRCQQTFHITVSLLEVGDYCLFLDEIETPLHCFQSATLEISRQLELTADTIIELKDMSSGILLAHSKIQLMTYIPVKQRRRRNLSWGLF